MVHISAWNNGMKCSSRSRAQDVPQEIQEEERQGLPHDCRGVPGRPRQEHVENGRVPGHVDELEHSGIPDPIGHFTEECARRNEAKRSGAEPVIARISPLQRVDIRDEGTRVELGAAVVDAYLNRDLGL